jgi:flagellar biosynthesis protein FlhF
MKIRKFVAADMKDALAQVKREMGNDAMIVATRPVRRGLLGNGIEVTAAVDLDDNAPSAATHAPPPSLTGNDIERMMAPLKSELRHLRSQLRQVDLGGGDAGVHKELREMRQILEILKRGASNDNHEISLSMLAAQHRLTQASEKRVVALVGPTGVGKTTTIAKLAAHAALLDRKSVAIVTLDGFRIGGEEQMRTYADLIGVPLTVSEPERLGEALETLASHDVVYVDTAGRSPRNAGAVAELARAFAGLDLEVHLTLPAGSSRTSIDACLERMVDVPIARLLFTKIDEAERLDELVRAPARLAKPISWITTGQRVPEDIETAVPERLLELATIGFQLAAEAA